MMRVLWFTNTPSLFSLNKEGYNGGGWISSLEELLKPVSNIDLGVSFFSTNSEKKIVKENTTYYPISLYSSQINKIKHNLFYSKYDEVEISEYLRIINDFQPEVIHVFGSEKSFGLISQYTNIPVVLHIQGVLNPLINSLYPPGCSVIDYFRYLSLADLFKKLKGIWFLRYGAIREQTILSNNTYFMGRTNWDYSISRLFAPESKYYHCDELLRKLFYEAQPWAPTNDTHLNLVTTISKVDYKGYDLVLKTAKLLKQFFKNNFTWKIFGIKEYNFWEKKLKIDSKSNNIELLGVGDSGDIISVLQRSDFYIHTSYIDNSPNSLCEAQMIGIPVISTNVGGISTLIEDKVTGFLVPANDPYLLTQTVIEVKQNQKLMKRVGDNGRQAALERHNMSKILKRNIEIYSEIINKQNK